MIKDNIRICKCGESLSKGTSLSFSTVEGFINLWKKQGGTIKNYKPNNSITLINPEGEEYFCIILDNLIFPFKFQ